MRSLTPHAQVNDRYAADLCSYLVGCQRGMLSAVATRLTGSADLFAPRWDAGLPGGLAAGRRAGFGLNAVAPLGDVPLGGVIDSENAVGAGLRGRWDGKDAANLGWAEGGRRRVQVRV